MCSEVIDFLGLNQVLQPGMALTKGTLWMGKGVIKAQYTFRYVDCCGDLSNTSELQEFLSVHDINDNFASCQNVRKPTAGRIHAN